MTQADKMYKLLWLKAFKEGEVRIPVPTKQHAARLRMALYNAAQAVKRHSLTNPELSQAVEHCLVTLQDADCTVVVMRKDATVIGEAVLGALGLSAEQLMAAEDGAAQLTVPVGDGEEAKVLQSLSQNAGLRALIERS